MKFKDLFHHLSAKNKTTEKNDHSIISRVIKRQESITRLDIYNWKTARMEAENTTAPKQTQLQVLYGEIMLDAKMSAQTGLRIDKSQSAQFYLKDPAGKVNKEATRLLADTGLYDKISELIIESKFYGSSVAEFAFNNDGKINIELVPRKHISPATGMFYPEVYGHGESYRQRSDYGSFIIEFYPKKDDLGLLNKAVPYVLMKKFALSCWSELCEIYGIPPRVMKTNTTDDAMLQRAEAMMKEIGSAAYFIIDTEEDFQFAQGTPTNGDVYKNLIATCDEQISLLNLGAVLGQDTAHGNRSKEETSSNLLNAIVEADKRQIQFNFNKIIIPALETLGILKPGLRLEIAKTVDTEKLWDMVFQASSYYDLDIDWLKETFGMEITGLRQNLSSIPQRQGSDFDFFA